MGRQVKEHDKTPMMIVYHKGRAWHNRVNSSIRCGTRSGRSTIHAAGRNRIFSGSDTPHSAAVIVRWRGKLIIVHGGEIVEELRP
jgi:hypothetical protein